MRELVVPATIEELPHVQEFVTGQLEEINCPMKIQFQIELAVEEIFVNIVNYAYRPEIGEAAILCEVTEDPLQVIISFLDHGKPFDPLKRQEADTSVDALEEREGGLGILLVKKNMDDVSYRYEDGKNILVIRKNLA